MTTTTNGADGFSTLADARYLSLTTYRRDGTAVATPVWVTSDDHRRLLVWTAADAWKTKRIRRDGHVRVAACSARGAVHGPSFDGEATVLDDTDLVGALILRKYGLQARAIRLYGALVRRLRRQEAPRSVTIAIEPRQLT
jgi:uncharacterized protein